MYIIIILLVLVLLIIIKFKINNTISTEHEDSVPQEYEGIFRYLSRQNQPEYKTEWLRKSIEEGHEIDGYYVIKSAENNLPYYCESEDEYERLCDNYTAALKDSVWGILLMIFYYHDRNEKTKNPIKKAYWKNKLIHMAENGNREAQAVLCSNYKVNITENFKLALFSENEIYKYKALYESKLLDDAMSGDKYAQMGIGKWLFGFDNIEKALLWLNKAADQCLTDACFYITGFLVLKEHAVNSSEEKNEIIKQSYEYYKRGAEYSNGIMAGYCQYRYGDECLEGNYIQKDLEQAKFWLKKAADNNIKEAKVTLELLQNGKL